ncbi:molybdate ABC transporter substrate-binding protein [Ruegeria sp. 6PALISEP08]|uniref:molybdate ABC transporter substrate-binding protein n=1 Tax=Ruegeria sp. 6PALISEP08 TaxID=1225660 RepID=UPI00067EE58C|nr:molybdate ABC transporter substrate-binding protein [Ruegeria sp. 6PALISEP08]
MTQTFTRRSWMVALVLGALALAPVRAGAEGVLVFAAASLKTALDEIAEGYEKETGHSVTVSYAASSVLARQIQQGAPADVFISANPDWMDVLEQGGLIRANSRVDLLGNALVLIGALGRTSWGEIQPDHDLEAELDGGFLAMALVDAVPAGIYGKAALQSLNQWNELQDHVAQTDNVRAALALVAAGAAPLGIVYRSDAEVEKRVSVVATIPADLHPAIIYPAAITTQAKDSAQAFLNHLRGDAALSVFQGQGFSLPGG